jgi:hypothetical protein
MHFARSPAGMLLPRFQPAAPPLLDFRRAIAGRIFAICQGVRDRNFSDLISFGGP